jgi:hypothetical protein
MILSDDFGNNAAAHAIGLRGRIDVWVEARRVRKLEVEHRVDRDGHLIVSAEAVEIIAA